MRDAQVVETYNQILDSQWALLEAWDKTVVEEPPGEKQIIRVGVQVLARGAE